MAKKPKPSSKTGTSSGNKIKFHGGAPDAVKREPPKGKGKGKTMKMK